MVRSFPKLVVGGEVGDMDALVTHARVVGDGRRQRWRLPLRTALSVEQVAHGA